MALLKEATRCHHDRLEAKVDVMRPDFGVSDYRRLLKRFYGIYAPIEEKLDAIAGLPDWELRRGKSAAILSDLGDAGVLPICSAPPAVDTLPAALGYLYVLEGATLGGQIISRHLRQTLGVESAFFSGYGDRTGMMWKRFAAAVERDGTAATIHAACATFGLFEAWLAYDET